MDRIAAIHARIPNTHLVMHGSSSVPQEWLAIIRQFGGDIKETYGVPVEEIQRGIKSGVRKINIDTDIRLAMTGAMRQVFAQQPDEFDPRKALVAAKNAARGIVKARFEAFGCAGQAGKIKPVSLGRDGQALRLIGAIGGWHGLAGTAQPCHDGSYASRCGCGPSG